jgi:hypothetical protein
MSHDPTNPAPPVLPVPLMPGNGITADMASARGEFRPQATPLPIYPSAIDAQVPAFDETAPPPFIEPRARGGVEL